MSNIIHRADVDSRRPRFVRLAGLAVAACVGVASLIVPAAPAAAAAGAHYVNCSLSTNGTGTATSPWNSLTSPNAHTFAAGDSLLFARGVTCNGSLTILNSGSTTSRITVDVYGSGTAKGIINGAGQPFAVKLVNTSNITVRNLDLKNSNYYGIFVTTTGTTVASGITLSNLEVHDVNGTFMDKKETGLVVVWPGAAGSKINNVVIDTVNAYNTNLWAGILVSGMNVTGDVNWRTTAQTISKRSTNITIKNSSVHDVQGDGILVLYGSTVLIDNNVVFRSGQQPTVTIGTPNAIWTFASNNALVQYNEAYDNDSPAQDGGAFDIDYFSSDTTVQYNYAHYNSTYCVAVFGAENGATTNSVIRYNICSNNATFGTATAGRSELYFGTWAGGWIDGLQVYNNTFYSTSNQGLATEITTDSGTGLPLTTVYWGSLPRVFRNNIVVDGGATASSNIYGNAWNTAFLTKSNNLYYRTTGSIPALGEPGSIYNQNPLVGSPWYFGIGEPTTQWRLQAGSPAINTGATYTAPALDYFKLNTPVGQRDIGANERQ